MIDWPASLIGDIARRRVVLFLGSGVSRNSLGTGNVRPPLWQGFLTEAIDRVGSRKKHIQSLVKRGDYLTACELLKKRLDDDWVPLIREQFVDPQYQPAEIHEEIFKLDARLVLTQNFDKIYDTYAQKESNNTVILKTYYDSDVVNNLRGDSRSIVKVHGTVDTPDHMIFTRSDYRLARFSHANFYSCLDALAITHTFVFLGCSLDDPDVKLMFERHAGSFPSARPHYMVSPKGIHKDVKSSIRENLSIKILDYDPKNNHALLTSCISSLRAAVESRRTEIAESQDW